MTNQLFRDYLDGKIPVNYWRQRYMLGAVAWVGPATASLIRFDPMNLLGAGFKPIGMIETDGYQFASGEGYDETLADYSARMRTKFTPEDAKRLVEMMEPAATYDRTTGIFAPRHGPPPSASWRGRGRVTKYKRG